MFGLYIQVSSHPRGSQRGNSGRNRSRNHGRWLLTGLLSLPFLTYPPDHCQGVVSTNHYGFSPPTSTVNRDNGPQIKPLVLSPAPHQPGLVTFVCNSSIKEMKAGGSQVQGHPCLHREFAANLGYLRACLKTPAAAISALSLYTMIDSSLCLVYLCFSWSRSVNLVLFREVVAGGVSVSVGFLLL